jgi:hypothetical protein
MVFEKGLLTKLFGLGGRKCQETGEDCIVRSLMVGTADVVMCILQTTETVQRYTVRDSALLQRSVG